LNGKFYALSPAGKQVWSYSAGSPIRSSAALSPDGHIYVGCDDHNIHALNADGSRQWVFPTTGLVRSSPAIGADGTIYCGSGDGKLYAINPDGTQKWNFRTQGPIYTTPAVGPNETIYVGSLDHAMYALGQNGTKQWAFVTGSGVSSSAIIGPDGSIYFGSDDMKIYALGPDGTQRWAFATGAGVSATPALASDGTLFIGSLDHQFYALNTANGSEVWQLATTNQIVSSAAITLGSTVCFASTDGYLYQLATTQFLASSSWPMFRRNVQHTASGFVGRLLPPNYSPGRTLVVELEANPPRGTGAYELEDQPPNGWTVGFISDNGLFDSSNMRVKFGPFFDDTPRIVTYQLTPPLNLAGDVEFSGWSSADDWNNAVGGDAILAYVPAHPADFDPVQGAITINDLTAYGAAWKEGTLWPVNPNPIPVNYVTRAASLWQSGEYYYYDPTVFAAPYWWVNPTSPPPGNSIELAPTYPSGTDGSITSVDMARQYSPGTPMKVQLQVSPASDRIVYAVEDSPPAGWMVTDISPPGQLDPLLGKIKWGPFFDDQQRTFSYAVIPPPDATGSVSFFGLASLDGTNLVFYGQRYTTDRPVVPSLSSVALQPDGTVQLAVAGEVGFFYVVEASTDLLQWIPITSFFSSSDVTVVTDTDAPQYSRRFYRAVLP
jgi:outer membrane protein assembly factor BamB